MIKFIKRIIKERKCEHKFETEYYYLNRHTFAINVCKKCGKTEKIVIK